MDSRYTKVGTFKTITNKIINIILNLIRIIIKKETTFQS